MRHLHHALVLVAILSAAVPAAAGDSERSRATLKGLEGVFVHIVDFDEQARNAGYDEKTFQTDLELKLRTAGIKVLTENEMRAAPGGPILNLAVTPLSPESSNDSLPCAINLSLRQEVMLATGQKADAGTWSVAGIGIGDLPSIRGKAKDYTDQFINAWMSVNPKP